MSKYPVVELSAQPFAYIEKHAVTEEIPKAMQEGFGALMAALGQARVAPAGMPLCHYISYDDASTTFELGFPVAPESIEAVRKAGLEIGKTMDGRVMKALHVGSYASLPTTYESMMAEIAAEGLEGTVDMWEAYFSPPETPPEETRTEVYWPIKQAA